MPRVATLLAGLAVTALALGLVLQAANGSLPGLTDESWVLIPLALGFPVVGAAIARQQPRHPIAWIFLGSGLGAGIETLTYEYAHYALVTKPGTVPLGVAAAWVSDWVWTTGAIPVLSFGLLLFPDGHLPSPRWRPVAWLAAATLTMFVFGSAFQPGPLGGYPDIPNPVGIDAAGPLFRVAQPVSAVCFAVVVVCSAASILIRFRRARGLQRQQLKWLAYAVAVATVALVLASREWAGWAVAQVVTLVAVGCIPVAIGVAILSLPTVRHRPADQPHPGLRIAHRPAGRGIRDRGVPRRPPARSGSGQIGAGRRGLDPGCSRVVPALAASHPEHGGPALQSFPLRRGQDRGGVQRPAARGDRPGQPLGRTAHRRRPDGAARPGLAVASAHWHQAASSTPLSASRSVCNPAQDTSAGVFDASVTAGTAARWRATRVMSSSCSQ